MKFLVLPDSSLNKTLLSTYFMRTSRVPVSLAAWMPMSSIFFIGEWFESTMEPVSSASTAFNIHV